MIKKKQKIISSIIWLILVIFWNFYYPDAKPIYDVLAAIVLALIFNLIKNIK